MKKRKIIALTLLVAFLCSLCIPGTWAIAGDGDNTPPVPENKGMEISKTAKDNGNGTYTITLEAYATGEKISTEVTKDVPTDIILVLDQSGSMGKEDFPSAGETTYEAYTGRNTQNSKLYDKRHNNNGNNGNLYYPLGDGVYVTVGVTRMQGESSYTYTQCGSDWKNYTYSSRDDDYRKYANKLYVKDGEEYKKVELDYKGDLFQGYTYTYQFPDGSTVVSEGNDGQPGLNNFDGKGPLYYVSNTTAGDYTYTYFYTDAEGNTINIGTSTGANTQFTDATLYRRNVTNGGKITRLQALKNAVTGFSDAVAKKAAGKDGVPGTADDVDHRIAVVGFSCSNTHSDNNNGKYSDYLNTELFIGSTEYKYGTSAQGQYDNAFQSMKTTDGQNNIIASIGALAADGATYVNHGMEMANGILDANPVPAGEKRNRVVIVFTDGTPGWNGYDENVADKAITQANTARSKGANVYSVGIFNGADANSPGNQNGIDTQKANWFMQNLSDNKGTPQSPSYYLSASDADTLNNIFQQISDQIQEGGSAIDLGSEAVIRDIISPQFQLPAGTTENKITLETYSYTGENKWSKNNDAMGATATVNDDQVNVTGFDFAENWCGTETNKDGTTTYRGNKLVISFPVEAKKGFLGGNGVYTNTEAGVYENAEAKKPLFTFNRPQVDVPIKDITVKAEDKNVYLLGALTAEQIKSGATAKVGEVTLDLTKADQNYGLATWQHEYVDIAVAYADKEGKVVIDLNDLTDDTTYTVTVKVVPKYEGEIKEKTGSAEGKINVFKPVLTFKDGEVYYGADVPDNDTLNKESFVPGATVWKHNETNADSVTMIGTAPANNKFAMTYAVDSGKIENGKINSKTVDIPVDVATVKIGDVDVTDHTTFQHIDCQGKTCTMPAGKEFLLHPQTCQLTVCKTGGAAGEPYVFNVYKDGDTNKPYTQVTIVGNDKETIYELPVGTYTIQEDTGWSWRYRGNNGDAAVLSATNPTGEITCTNSKNDNKWLNGYSTVVKNIFGVSHNN